MVLYVIYKNTKKEVHETKKELAEIIESQIIAIEEHKIPELKEQIIDVVKLGGAAVEIIPLVPLSMLENDIPGVVTCPV